MLDSQPTIVRGQTLTLTVVRQVVVVRWTGATSEPDVGEMRRISDALGRRHPGGIAHMNVIDVPPGQIQRPSESARHAMVQMLRDRHVPLRAASVIFPHDGFQAAVVRSILGTLLLLSRTPAIVRVHSSVHQGAGWIGERLGPSAEDPPPSVEELAAAVRTLGG